MANRSPEIVQCVDCTPGRRCDSHRAPRVATVGKPPVRAVCSGCGLTSCPPSCPRKMREKVNVLDRPIPLVPATPKVTHALESGEPFVFVSFRGQAVGVPSALARQIAREIIMCAAEAEAEARRKKTEWKP